MQRFRSTLILLVVAVGLGAYLYFVDAKRPVEETNAKKKVFSYETDKIDQVTVRSAAGETSLKKAADGNWSIVKPIEAAADKNNVNDVVSTLANLEEERAVEENAADLKPYGLAEPRIDVTFNVSGEKEAKHLQLGDKTPTGAGVYAKLPGNSRVFMVPSNLDASLNRSTFDFRDKTAVKIDQEKVNAIDLVSKTSKIRLEKEGENWKLVSPVQAPADFISVQGLLGQISSAQMQTLKDQPQDLKDLKQYGLDAPEIVATIGMGGTKLVLQLGKQSDMASYWARDAAKPAVFSINNGLAEELKKTASDFRRKEVFAFRPFNATRFEIVRGSETRAFERVKGTGDNALDTWKQIAPAAKPVDSSNFEGALLEFSNLRADSFVERADASTGLAKPVATITAKFDDGKQEEKVTFGRSASGVFAVRADQPGALKLDTAKFDEAVKKLDSIQ